MVFDLEQRFCAVEEKYRLCREDTEVFRYRLFYRHLAGALAALAPGAQIALWGNDYSARDIYSALLPARRKNVLFYICPSADAHDYFLPLPGVGPDELGRRAPDAVILTEYAGREESAKTLKRLLPQAAIIDAYALVEKDGFDLGHAIYPIGDFSGILYRYLADGHRRLQQAAGAAPRAAALRAVISDHCQLRDFVEARRYIEQYIAARYAGHRQYQLFLQELDALLLELGTAVQSAHKDNVYIFLPDSLPVEALEHMPALQRFTEDSCWFGAAYSPGFYTKAALFSFFTGKDYLADQLFRLPALPRSESALLQKMQREGRRFLYFSQLQHLAPANDYAGAFSMGETQSLIQWGFLCELAKNSGPALYMLHFMETHPPYYNGHPCSQNQNLARLKNTGQYRALYQGSEEEILWQMFRDEEQQERYAWAYADAQLHFCLELLAPADKSVIVMSDHGNYPDRKGFAQEVIPDNSIFTKRMQNVFIVHSPALPKPRHDPLYGLIDFSNLLDHMLFQKGPYTPPEFEFVVREREPSYSRNILRVAKTVDGEFFHFHAGLYSLLNEREEYILNLDGHEEYRVDRRNTNEIDNEKYADRVALCRKLASGLDLQRIWDCLFEMKPHLRDFYRGCIPDRFVGGGPRP
ncbi:MAG: sulfatase-like hydrolase/transferase [Oscillospiraceae bacterium]